jgi:hypothetical protein
MTTSLTFIKNFRVVSYEKVKETLDYDEWANKKWVRKQKMPEEEDEDFEKRCKSVWDLLTKNADRRGRYELDDGEEDGEEGDDFTSDFWDDIIDLTDKAFCEIEKRLMAEFMEEVAAHGEMYTRDKKAIPRQATLTQKQKEEKVAALRAELALLGVVKGNCNCDHCADSISRCKIPVAKDCEFYVAPK